MAEKAPVSGRLVYIDNLRLFMIILIVLLHLAIVYGAAGNWALKEEPSDEISPIIFTFFTALVQSFSLSMFYMLSGYFVPASYDKKGPKKFLADRFIRLGVPVLVYVTLIKVFLDYLFINYHKGLGWSLEEIIVYNIQHPSWSTGPLWFIEALLVFCIAYALYRVVFNLGFGWFKDAFPSNKTIIPGIVFLAAGTFVFRAFSPIGVEWMGFQLGHFFHYIIFFWLGIQAYRNKWLENLSSTQAKTWKKIVVLAIIAMPIMLVVAVKDNDLAPVMGGFTWQSMMYSTWESIACVSIIISLLDVFRKRFNAQGPLLRWMAPQFYAVYLLHQIMIISVTLLLWSVSLPTYIKLFVAAGLVLPLCFIGSDLLRRIPCAKKVLG